MLQENCYIIHDESKECVIIDCGAFYEQERSAIQQYISKNQLQPVQLIGTHGHVDHHFGNAFLYKEYGLLPTVHQADKFLMEQLNEQAEYFAGVHLTEQMPMPQTYFSEDDKISFGSHTLTILETPGPRQEVCSFTVQRKTLPFQEILFSITPLAGQIWKVAPCFK